MAACFALALHAQAPDDWAVARDGHFEVYSQAGEKSATAGLAWLEELRDFVTRQTGLVPDTPEPVRVIAFQSAADYAPYRLRSLSDAYYVGSGARNYMVLSSIETDGYGNAAHEYAHCLFRLAGLDLPSWLREGIAEVFSSVRMTRSGVRIGGDLAARTQLLRLKPWLPLARILSWPDTPLDDEREAVEMFYSESWALAEMLAFAPQYQPGFRKLVAAIAAGAPSQQALQQIYGKNLEQIAADLRYRATRRAAIPLAAAEAPPAHVKISRTSWFDVRVMLAGLMILVRDYDRANGLYSELAHEAPGRAEVTAGLGAVALGRGDRAEAERLWKKAMGQGLADGDIAYQYALLLDAGGDRPEELRAALELTIRLRPDLKDARFRLALLEENSGRHEAALAQLQAMGKPAAPQAYSYQCTRAQALIGLGRNGEAAQAAADAVAAASNAEERVYALQIAHLARSHLDVQFTRDEAGNLKLTTTRVDNDAPHWNAFVEPGDDLRRAEGTLRAVECDDGGLRLVVETASGKVVVAVPDPSHVEMRNAPAEFVCGTQEPSRVVVEYAAGKGPAAGIARGVEFVGKE